MVVVDDVLSPSSDEWEGVSIWPVTNSDFPLMLFWDSVVTTKTSCVDELRSLDSYSIVVWVDSSDFVTTKTSCAE